MKHLFFILAISLLASPAIRVFAESSDQKTGRELHEKILQEMPVITDGKLADYVKKVGLRVAKTSDTPDLEFTFTLLDDPGINAFATPGGYIYINRGLITYLNSEAQLAAVLAHEVGHITERHHARKNRAQAGSQITSVILAVLTRSNEVGEASGLWRASQVQGYGLDMELEADEKGAQFLYRAGYPPQAMIEVVSLLKDHERLEKMRAKASGKKTQTYHGLFASHPRNDQRLREVINKAGTLPQTLSAETNVVPFRLATEGMVWGQNIDSQEKPKNRYQNATLGFLIDYPEGWVFSSHSNALKSHNADNTARMDLSMANRTTEPPELFIKKQLAIPLLKKSESFVQAGLRGHTGLIPGKKTPASTTPDQRLAVIYYGRLAYIFKGEILLKDDSSAVDKKQANDDFMSIIKSFRPISRRALQAQQAFTIHYVKATANTTFAALANHLKLGKFGEEELRIINNYYPTGEPKPGEWIKIIRQ